MGKQFTPISPYWPRSHDFIVSLWQYSLKDLRSSITRYKGFNVRMNCAQIHAIIFDLDGVILDSVALKTELFLRCYDGELDEAQKAFVREYQAHHGGVGRAEKFKHFEAFLFGRNPDDARINKLIKLYQMHLFEEIDDCALLPGVIEFLKFVQKSCDLHLVSGTLHEDLLRIAKTRSLTDYFNTIAGSPMTKNDAFANIIKRANYHPDAVLAIGDSITEYEVARACGIHFVGIVAPNEPNRFPLHVAAFKNLLELTTAWKRSL